MDFYGFSSGVAEANALQSSGDLANSQYDAMNTGANMAYMEKNIREWNKKTKADTDSEKTVEGNILTEQEEEGGGTGVAVLGVAAVGKSTMDTANKVGKAIRIAEAQIEITKAAIKNGTATAEDLKRATGLLDVAKSGKLAEVAKSVAKIALTKAVSGAASKNLDKLGALARAAQKGSSFSPAAIQSVTTKGGRVANQVLTKQAEIAEQTAETLKEGASALGGGDIVAKSQALSDLPFFAPLKPASPPDTSIETDTSGPRGQVTQVAEEGSDAVESARTAVQGGQAVAKGLTEGVGDEGDALIVNKASDLIHYRSLFKSDAEFNAAKNAMEINETAQKVKIANERDEPLDFEDDPIVADDEEEDKGGVETNIPEEEGGGAVQGVEGRPSTFKQVNVKEEFFGDDYENVGEELQGFESNMTDPDAIQTFISDKEGGLVDKTIEGTATNLSAMRRGTQVGTESTGVRGLFGTMVKGIAGEKVLDVTAGLKEGENWWDDDPEPEADLGKGGSKGAGNLVRGAIGSQDDVISGVAETTESKASKAARALAGLFGRAAPEAVDATGKTAQSLEIEDDDLVSLPTNTTEETSAVSSTLSEATSPESLTNSDTGQANEATNPTSEEASEQAQEQSSTGGEEQTSESTVREGGEEGEEGEIGVAGRVTETGEASKGAIVAGEAASKAAIKLGGGLDTKALEVGAEALKGSTGVAAAVGRTALKGVGFIGQGMKIAGPIGNAAFFLDQSGTELASVFGKKHQLSGDGTAGKVGGVLAEVGDTAALYGSYLAMTANPIGDAAALGIELGGGALALVGDLFSDYGSHEKEIKEKADAAKKVAADKVATQKADITSSAAVQSETAATAANYAGQGTIAQASRSAIRAF